MINKLGIALLFCFLCNSLNSYAEATSKHECYEKYGSTMFEPFQAIKDRCIRACWAPEEQREASANETNFIEMCERTEINQENNANLDQCIGKYGATPGLNTSSRQFDEKALKNLCALTCHYPELAQTIKKRAHMDETTYETMCERAEDNAENNKNLEQCIAKYGGISSFNMKTSAIDEALKYGCAMSCQYPESIQLMKNQTFLNETGYNTMCERAIDNQENNFKMEQCFSKYGASKQLEKILRFSGQRIEINKTLCAVDCAIPELGHVLHELIRTRLGGLFNPECNGLETVGSDSSQKATEHNSL